MLVVEVPFPAAGVVVLLGAALRVEEKKKNTDKNIDRKSEKQR